MKQEIAASHHLKITNDVLTPFELKMIVEILDFNIFTNLDRKALVDMIPTAIFHINGKINSKPNHYQLS